MTIPIALLMGVYMRYFRPGRVMEASAIGFALVLFAVVAGQWVAQSAVWAPVFTLTGPALALAVIVYGFAASALPVWLLLDAGTRVGRFMVQELAGRFFPALRTASWTSTLVTSGVIVGAWGYLLYQGVLDTLGGINSLWPLFGIANQILASVALVVATTILIKMRRTRSLWVTLVPMAWLVAVTLTGAAQKLFHEDPRIGFLSQVRALEQRIDEGRVPEAKLAETRHVIFNNRLDAGVTAFFAFLILLLLAEAATEWYRILTGRRTAALSESPYVRTKWAGGSA